MGLMQALHKFDPEKGFRFSTYAMFWIKAEIYETILNNWSIVRIGSSANQKRVFFNLARAKRALGIMDNNLSDDQTKQIADYLGIKGKDNNEKLEGLIKAKGFGDCIVTMSTDNVNIVVMDEELSLEEAAQILNIVETETSFIAPDVVIVPYV